MNIYVIPWQSESEGPMPLWSDTNAVGRLDLLRHHLPVLDTKHRGADQYSYAQAASSKSIPAEMTGSCRRAVSAA